MLNKLKIRLSAVRVNAGLSQQDIADKMGVSRITVGNWESGKAKMKEAELRMFADICNFPRENIFLPY
jgi:DNA-binding transcriptional regulator YiaG